MGAHERAPRRRARLARIFVVAVAAVAGVGCGNKGKPAELLMRTIPDDVGGVLDVVVTNIGDAPTRALTMTFDSADIFSLGVEDCTGAVVAPQAFCAVRIEFPASAEERPSGSLTVDDGHGAHASTTLTATLSFAKLVLDGEDVIVDVREGDQAATTVRVSNTGHAPSGPISLDYLTPLADDNCSGVRLPPNNSCAFSVAYAAPVGQLAPVTLSGAVWANPGGAGSFDVHFNILPLLAANGPSFSPNAVAGARTTVDIQDLGATPIGPLQVSIEGADGTPAVAYPPFVLGEWEDTCSGQMLSPSTNTCGISVELDPRLPAGGSYSATFVIRAGLDTLSIPFSATRGTP